MKLRTLYFLLLASLAQGVTLTWTDNSENEAAFEIERSEEGQTFQKIGAVGQDINSYTDATVEVGKEYFYRVRAINQWGASGYTNVVTSGVIEPDGKSPAAPSDTNAEQIKAQPVFKILIHEDGTVTVSPIETSRAGSGTN